MSNRSLKRTASAVTLGVIGAITAAAGGASAQQAAPAEPAAAALDEVVVTARRREEKLQDVPVAVTALSGEALTARGVQTIADLTKFSPSVYVAPSSRSATGVRFIMRGQTPVDSLLTSDPSAAIYVNEVYVPRDYGLRTALFDIERVEVLKGPQGTLYGRNSTGGAIGIITRRPQLDGHSGYATVGYGSHNTWTAEAATDVPLIRDVAAARFGAYYSRTDGYVRNTQGGRPDAGKQLSLRGSILARPTSNLEVAGAVSYTRTAGQSLFFRLLEAVPGVQPGDIEAGLRLGNPIASAGPAGDAYLRSQVGAYGRFTNGAAQQRADHFEGTRGSLVVRWDAADFLTVKSITGYETFQRSSLPDLDTTPLPIGQTLTTTHDKFFSQELQASGGVGERVTYVAGLYYGREKGTEIAKTSTLPLVGGSRLVVQDGTLTNTNVGVYAQGDYKLTDHISLTAGVRRTKDTRDLTLRHRDLLPTSATAVCTIQPVLLDVPGVCSANLDALKFKNTSYNFSVRYTPVETVNLYATARKSYRSGGWNLFASAANGVASFEPEKVKDIEVGAKTEWLDRRLQANLALYHSKYTDIQKQRLTFLPNGTGVRMISNAAAAAINGAELEIRAKPTQGLTLDFQTTYTDPHYKNFVTRNPTTGAIADDRTAEPWEVPKWTFTVGAEQRWKVAPGELIARLDYSWRGDVIFAGTNQLTSTEQVLRQGSYGLLSGRLELALDHPDISIALIGRNLTDKDFLAGGIDLRSLGWSVGIPGEPRYVGLQITSRWR